MVPLLGTGSISKTSAMLKRKLQMLMIRVKLVKYIEVAVVNDSE